MYKQLIRKMCENAIEREFLSANDGQPLVEYAKGIDTIQMGVSEIMKDTITFKAHIAMRTTDEVEVWGYADEYGAHVTHYVFDGDIITLK